MFVKLSKQLKTLHWEWHFLSILSFGAIVCSSAYANIRKLVMEEGLLVSLSESDHENSWKERCASVVSLSEIYQQFKSEPHGLVARKAIEGRARLEKNEIVLGMLKNPKAKSPQQIFTKRMSFLFKHTSVEFAESYVALQSDYQYMKNYIQNVEKSEAKFHQRMKNRIGKGSRIMRSHHSKEYTVDPKHLSTRNKQPPKFENLKDIKLPSHDYHYQYKNVELDPEIQRLLLPDLHDDMSVTLPQLKPSIFNHKLQMAQDNLSLNNPNRRKLFQPTIPKPAGHIHSIAKSEQEPIKIPLPQTI